MIQEAAFTAMAIDGVDPDLRGFLGRKPAEARMLMQHARQSFVDSWRSLKAAPRGKKFAMAGAVAANTAFMYGDDIALYHGTGKVREAMGDVVKSPEKGVIAFTAAAIVSGGINWVLTKFNEKSDFVMKSARNARPVANPESETDPQGLQRGRIRGHAGKLASTLTIGVPATRSTQHLTPREVVAHSAIYGTSAAAIYSAGLSFGLFDRPVVAGAVVAGIVADRYVRGALEPDVPQPAVMDPVAEAVTLPVPEAHVPIEQIAPVPKAG